MTQKVKHLPAMWQTWIWFLGREDPLEKEMATYSSTLAWKIPWTEEPGRLQSMRSQRVGHDWVSSLCAAWLPHQFLVPICFVVIGFQFLHPGFFFVLWPWWPCFFSYILLGKAKFGRKSLCSVNVTCTVVGIVYVTVAKHSMEMSADCSSLLKLPLTHLAIWKI